MTVEVLQRMASAKRGKALVALAIALSLGSCSPSEEDARVPVDCKEGPRAVRAALADAPAHVELGSTPLSGCFTRGASSADLQQVGASYLSAATTLAEEARRDPESPAALRLGFLIGATRRGAAQTQGIHEELIRRIEQELIGVDTGSAAYRRGYRAGRSRG